jgi:hypothetical protein
LTGTRNDDAELVSGAGIDPGQDKVLDLLISKLDARQE